MLTQAYSLWQYRLYLTSLALFFFIKFSFVILGQGGNSPSIGDRFAAASGLFLTIHLISAYALFWSLMLLECAWLYIFIPFESADSIAFSLISLLIIPPAIASFQLTSLSKYSSSLLQRSGKKSAFKSKQLDRNWQIPLWLFYSAQLLFLASLSLWFFYEEAEAKEFAFMQFLFSLFIFNPRWLKPKEMKSKQKPIIFFDALCLLCNRWVEFLLKEDYLHNFRFSSLQGKLAPKLLALKDIEGTQYLVLYKNKNEIYHGAEACLWLARELGGIWRIFAWSGYLIPQVLRSRLYAFFAARRYRYFGQAKECYSPSKEEKGYFFE